ncbi:MAG: proton-conducting transporter membrane subunit, partial [Desulfurococcaceae archaeon]
LYFTVFTGDSIIAEFRSLMISILVIISSFSAIVASTIVMRQKTIRGLVAYSSIVQFSLALLGITSETVEGISGGILHLVVKALGDTLVLISAGSIIHSPTILREKTGQMLVYICTIVGLLNLFGVIPILPGFWSKAFLTLGFVKADMTFGAATVLISSGLCAIGYFKIIIALVSMKPLEESENVTREAKNAIPKVLMTIVLALVIAFGLSILMIGQVRSYLLGIGTRALDRSRLINFLYSNTN